VNGRSRLGALEAKICVHAHVNSYFIRYFSPYPLTESEVDDISISQGQSSSASQGLRIPGVHRATLRSHGRTSDLLAGGLGRTHALGEKSMLWVCDRCFKYMADGLSWELHTVCYDLMIFSSS